MRLSISWSTLAIWVAVSVIAVISCSLSLRSAHLGEDYFPVGHDSFYHARRILDAVQDPSAFYQFDSKIHAPEGSLLVWPWGYDYLIATIVRFGLALGLSTDPLTILLWIPVATVTLTIALLISVSRRLGLSTWLVALAALCMALAPTTQLLNGVGAIDHHYVELICILAALTAGLAWFRAPNVPTSIALGSTFGLSLGIHNGLFVLQIPFLITLLAGWLQGNMPPRRPIVTLVVSLLVCTVAVLIPSLPFQLGRFEFYTLSWFHLYIAGGTAVVVLFLHWLKATRNSILALTVVAVVMVAPLFDEIRTASGFLTGTLGTLSTIEEMRSPMAMAMQPNERLSLSMFYSFLFWLAPVTFVLCVLQCWRNRRSPLLLFWLTSALGLAMLSTQLRMHYFGGFALYLPWLVLVQDYASRRLELQRRTYLIATLVLLLAYIPQIRYALIHTPPRAADPWFEHLQPMLKVMRDICAKDPGVVLADSTAGHYIRYYTSCSVIANNFLLTERQFQKVDEVMRLMGMSPEEVPKAAPYVKYVLIRAGSITHKPEGGYSFTFYGVEKPRLATALLLSPAQQGTAGYTLLNEINFTFQYQTLETVPYARFYRIEPQLTAPATSANEVSN